MNDAQIISLALIAPIIGAMLANVLTGGFS
jgi:hypothetical protein